MYMIAMNGFSGRRLFIQTPASVPTGRNGIIHRDWRKVAVVTDKEWLRHSVNIFGYLIPGEIKAFPAAAEGDARAWVAS